MKIALPLLATALVLATTSMALADVPPPPGYVESCTVAKQVTKGLECVKCSTYHGERDKCEKDLGAKGYTRACKTRGASTWSEVWCKEKAEASPVEVKPAAKSAKGGGKTARPEPAASATPSDEADKGGSKCSSGAGATLPVALLMAMALLARRRVRA